MGIEFLMSTKNPSSGIINHGKETAEEMKRPRKLGTSSMMETCQSRGEGIRCPIPQKTSRLNRERDLRVVHDLSDIITSKASPPYYVGSPPVRASNPLIHDSQFCAWAVQSAQQPPGIPIPTKGFNICCNHGREGFHTKA